MIQATIAAQLLSHLNAALFSAYYSKPYRFSYFVFVPMGLLSPKKSH